MADDIKIKLGLDAAELFNGLNKVTTELNQVQNESKQTDQALDKMADINTSGAVADVNKLSAAIDGVGDSAGGLGGVLDGLKGGLGDALSGGLIGGLVGGGLAAGVQAGVGAIIDGFGAVVDAGRGLISAQGDLQAQTGATGAEFEALKASAEDAFLGGVGESVAEATKVISNAAVVLKGALPADEIGAFTAKAQALGNLYEKDVNEVISKSAPFIKQFGLDGDEAFNLIAFAAKEGKTSQDDVLDTLAEYSQLLQEAGFSAEEFAGQMAIAGQEGLFNTDKIADSIKEAQIRLKAGDTAKAFTDIKNQLPQALGSTLGNLEQLASSGQITIKEFLQKSGETIKTAFDAGQISEAMATQLQVAVAGTPAEDIGVEAYNKMFGAPIPVDEIKAKAAQAGQDASNAVGQYLSFDVVGRNLSLAFEKGSALVVGGLSQTFGMIATAVGPAMSELGNTISGVFERIWSVIGPILGLIGGAIMANISNILTTALEIVNLFYETASYAFDQVILAVQPLIDAIKSALGIDGAMGEGIDVVKMLQEAMNFMSGAISAVFDVLQFLGKILIDVIVYGFKLVIGAITLVVEGITKFITWIGNLIAKIPGITSVFEALKSGFDKVYNFFANLPQVIDEVQVYLKAFGMTFQDIFRILGEAFESAKNLDFSGAYDKLSSVFSKQTWIESLVKNVRTVKAELKGTSDEAKKTSEEIKKIQQQNTSTISIKPKATAETKKVAKEEVAKIAKDPELKIETGIKPKPEDFKEFLKEYTDLAKEIEKTSESLVPKTLATSQEALDGTIATVQQYIDFIKLQNDEIALKQAEAIAAGNQDAADKFGESIQTNIQNINLLSSRLERFGTESKAAIEKAARESTLEFQIQTALQTSILDAFNSEKIRKEKEANDAIREERLGALNAEEDDLTKSLAKREISFEDYAAKIADIDAQRKQVEEQTEVTALQRLKTLGDQTAASVFKSQSEIFMKNAENMEGNQKVFNEFIGQTLAGFGELAASGEATLADFGGAVAGAAFDAIAKMIPSFVVGILGSSITTLGPIFGPLAAATLTGTLYGLLGLARSAVGFKDGVVGLKGPGDERSDSIPAWLSKGESVITAAGTKANRQELEWMNNNPGMSIRDYFTSNAPQMRYSVQEDGNLIQEVRKLREETRGLGKQINRNTHVEISGALVADNNSIKAVIERDRRRNARRG
jgi:phage-related minor tail protein